MIDSMFSVFLSSVLLVFIVAHVAVLVASVRTHDRAPRKRAPQPSLSTAWIDDPYDPSPEAIAEAQLEMNEWEMVLGMKPTVWPAANTANASSSVLSVAWSLPACGLGDIPGWEVQRIGGKSSKCRHRWESTRGKESGCIDWHCAKCSYAVTQHDRSRDSDPYAAASRAVRVRSVVPEVFTPNEYRTNAPTYNPIAAEPLTLQEARNRLANWEPPDLDKVNENLRQIQEHLDQKHTRYGYVRAGCPACDALQARTPKASRQC